MRRVRLHLRRPRVGGVVREVDGGGVADPGSGGPARDDHRAAVLAGPPSSRIWYSALSRAATAMAIASGSTPRFGRLLVGLPGKTPAASLCGNHSTDGYRTGALFARRMPGSGIRRRRHGGHQGFGKGWSDGNDADRPGRQRRDADELVGSVPRIEYLSVEVVDGIARRQDPGGDRHDSGQCGCRHETLEHWGQNRRCVVSRWSAGECSPRAVAPFV